MDIVYEIKLSNVIHTRIDNFKRIYRANEESVEFRVSFTNILNHTNGTGDLHT